MSRAQIMEVKSYLEESLSFIESKEMRDYLQVELPKFKSISLSSVLILSHMPQHLLNESCLCWSGLSKRPSRYWLMMRNRSQFMLPALPSPAALP